MYEDQLYIQPSVHMIRKVEAAMSEALQQGSVDMPRVRWNPYIITGPILYFMTLAVMVYISVHCTMDRACNFLWFAEFCINHCRILIITTELMDLWQCGNSKMTQNVRM